MFTFVVGALVVTLHLWGTFGYRRQWCYRTPHSLARLKVQVLAGNQQCNHAYRHHNYRYPRRNQRDIYCRCIKVKGYLCRFVEVFSFSKELPIKSTFRDRQLRKQWRNLTAQHRSMLCFYYYKNCSLLTVVQSTTCFTATIL